MSFNQKFRLANDADGRNWRELASLTTEQLLELIEGGRTTLRDKDGLACFTLVRETRPSDPA